MAPPGCRRRRCFVMYRRDSVTDRNSRGTSSDALPGGSPEDVVACRNRRAQDAPAKGGLSGACSGDDAARCAGPQRTRAADDRYPSEATVIV